MILSMLLGVGYLTAAPAPRTLLALMPHPVIYVWASMFLASGALAFWAIVRQASLAAMSKDVSGGHPLILERAALWIQDGALFVIAGCSIYAWAIDYLADAPVLGLGLLFAWLAANLWRDRQILSLISELTADDDGGEIGGR